MAFLFIIASAFRYSSLSKSNLDRSSILRSSTKGGW